MGSIFTSVTSIQYNCLVIPSSQVPSFFNTLTIHIMNEDGRRAAVLGGGGGGVRRGDMGGGGDDYSY